MIASEDTCMSGSYRYSRARRIPYAGAIFWGLALCAALTPVAAVAGPGVAPIPPQSAPAASPLLQRVAVFGKDERRPVPQSFASVASKIGVLHDTRSHSVCTAFCVAPSVVATAGHCLYRTSDEKPLRLSDIRVHLSGSTTKSRIAGVSRGVPEPNVLAGSMRLKVRPPIDATHDWALVRLEKPLCKAGAFKIARRSVSDVMRLARAGRIYNIAYHRDLPKWQPMLATGCGVKRNFKDADWPTIRRDFADPEQLILHTCDTAGASSGSPLIINGPDGPEVVGINVGTYIQSKVVMLNGEVVHRFKSDDVANTGVNSLAFSYAVDAFRNADILASRRDVLKLQHELAGRGLYTGPYDGIYGTATKAAIEQFERAAQMPVTGLATTSTLHVLTAESPIVTSVVPTNAHKTNAETIVAPAPTAARKPR
jgi:Putative peptidoglycan binding domain/Trypsin-like peptidase domain